MPRITVLPHAVLCPEGAAFEARSGSFLCDAMLKHGIALEHACEKSCACATCHVIVLEGYASLAPPGEDEEDQLDRAWGAAPRSRLSCQVVLRQTDLLLKLPLYTVNHASEKN